jgi:hypothetical protein
MSLLKDWKEFLQLLNAAAGDLNILIPSFRSLKLLSYSCEFVSIRGPNGLLLRPRGQSLPNKTILATNGHESSLIGRTSGLPKTQLQNTRGQVQENLIISHSRTTCATHITRA